MRDPASTVNRATYVNGVLKPDDGSMMWNHEAVWTAAWPAATGITDARSLARLYAACVGEVDGIRVLRPETGVLARAEASFGADATSLLPSRFGLGFNLHHDLAPLLGPTSFGHGGMGGSLAFADVDAAVGFGYAMNQMRIDGKRTAALVTALRACLQ
jgi:CubicO group peptidase (beta-lactamase class C family)